MLYALMHHCVQVLPNPRELVSLQVPYLGLQGSHFWLQEEEFLPEVYVPQGHALRIARRVSPTARRWSRGAPLVLHSPAGRLAIPGNSVRAAPRCVPIHSRAGTQRRRGAGSGRRVVDAPASARRRLPAVCESTTLYESAGA